MRINKSFGLIFLLACVSISTTGFSQDSTWSWDGSFPLEMETTYYMSSICEDYSFKHSPTEYDLKVCKRNKKYLYAEPNEKNHSKYFPLAVSLWEVSRLEESEMMFLKIVNSSEGIYVQNKYYSSDIPGDTSSNSYGYGSYTFSYKHEVCIYLAKIYIEERKFDQALKYITDADKKYPEAHNCGTGYRWYRKEIDGLYGLCYEGLGWNDSIYSMFLQGTDWCNMSLIRILKRVYSQKEIDEYIKVAENSIACVVDTFQSSNFLIENWGKPNETRIESKYFSGHADMSLFGRNVNIPLPDLKDGETITREKFINMFRRSEFYSKLTGSE